MKITREQATHVARLAKLSMSERETEQLTSQLEQILTYIDQLNALDTTGVEPTSHAIFLENVFRDDRVAPSLPVETALKNAPDRENGFFKVPKVIE